MWMQKSPITKPNQVRTILLLLILFILRSKFFIFLLITDMVVLFLKKVQEGAKWTFLRKSEMVKAEKPAFAPEASEPGEDPSQGLMKMMKKMYEEGDDEMKRTIAKAWTEGNSKRTPGDMGDLAGLGGGMAGMDL